MASNRPSSAVDDTPALVSQHAQTTHIGTHRRASRNVESSERGDGHWELGSSVGSFVDDRCPTIWHQSAPTQHASPRMVNIPSQQAAGGREQVRRGVDLLSSPRAPTVVKSIDGPLLHKLYKATVAARKRSAGAEEVAAGEFAQHLGEFEQEIQGEVHERAPPRFHVPKLSDGGIRILKKGAKEAIYSAPTTQLPPSGKKPQLAAESQSKHLEASEPQEPHWPARTFRASSLRAGGSTNRSCYDQNVASIKPFPLPTPQVEQKLGVGHDTSSAKQRPLEKREKQQQRPLQENEKTKDESLRRNTNRDDTARIAAEILMSGVTPAKLPPSPADASAKVDPLMKSAYASECPPDKTSAASVSLHSRQNPVNMQPKAESAKSSQCTPRPEAILQTDSKSLPRSRTSEKAPSFVSFEEVGVGWLPNGAPPVKSAEAAHRAYSRLSSRHGSKKPNGALAAEVVSSERLANPERVETSSRMWIEDGGQRRTLPANPGVNFDSPRHIVGSRMVSVTSPECPQPHSGTSHSINPQVASAKSARTLSDRRVTAKDVAARSNRSDSKRHSSSRGFQDARDAEAHDSQHLLRQHDMWSKAASRVDKRPKSDSLLEFERRNTFVEMDKAQNGWSRPTRENQRGSAETAARDGHWRDPIISVSGDRWSDAARRNIASDRWDESAPHEASPTYAQRSGPHWGDPDHIWNNGQNEVHPGGLRKANNAWDTPEVEMNELDSGRGSGLDSASCGYHLPDGGGDIGQSQTRPALSSAYTKGFCKTMSSKWSEYKKHPLAIDFSSRATSSAPAQPSTTSCEEQYTVPEQDVAQRDHYTLRSKLEESYLRPSTVFAGRGWISPHPLSCAPSEIASPPQSKIILPRMAIHHGETMTYQEWKEIQERGFRLHRNFSHTESSQTKRGKLDGNRYRFAGWGPHPTDSYRFDREDSVDQRSPTGQIPKSRTPTVQTDRSHTHGEWPSREHLLDTEESVPPSSHAGIAVTEPGRLKGIPDDFECHRFNDVQRSKARTLSAWLERHNGSQQASDGSQRCSQSSRERVLEVMEEGRNVWSNAPQLDRRTPGRERIQRCIDGERDSRATTSQLYFERYMEGQSGTGSAY